jgi:hypothetical protein
MFLELGRWPKGDKQMKDDKIRIQALADLATLVPYLLCAITGVALGSYLVDSQYIALQIIGTPLLVVCVPVAALLAFVTMASFGMFLFGDNLK